MKRKAILIVVLIMSLSGWAKAEEPVLFADSQLEHAVEDLLGPDPTPTDMLDLTYLDAASSDILHLGGLEHAVNLTYLDLSVNWIGDISPISGLVKLEHLYIEDNLLDNVSALGSLTNLSVLWLNKNEVSNISALATLKKLAELNLDENQVSDISALGSLADLEYLWLYDNQIDDIFALAPLENLIELDLGANQISDISPIALSTRLELLYLDENPLNTPSYCTYLPLIEVGNLFAEPPGYDPNPNPFTNDCSTNMAELAQWASSWLSTGCGIQNNWCSGGALDHFADLELPDFAQFARLWLAAP